jgi:hypothetical protein
MTDNLRAFEPECLVVSELMSKRKHTPGIFVIAGNRIENTCTVCGRSCVAVAYDNASGVDKIYGVAVEEACVKRG